MIQTYIIVVLVFPLAEHSNEPIVALGSIENTVPYMVVHSKEIENVEKMEDGNVVEENVVKNVFIVTQIAVKNVFTIAQIVVKNAYIVTQIVAKIVYVVVQNVVQNVDTMVQIVVKTAYIVMQIVAKIVYIVVPQVDEIVYGVEIIGVIYEA